MERVNSYEKVLNSYFISPWQPSVNVKKILEQPKDELDNFLKDVIEKDVTEKNKKPDKSKEETEYIKDVIKELKQFKWNRYREKMEKKLPLYKFALLPKTPPLTIDEQKELHREKLRNDLTIKKEKITKI